LAVASVVFAAPSAATPIHIYLTWQGNTSNTITVNIHTTSADPVTVHFDAVTRSGQAANYAFNQSGPSHQIPGLDAHVTRYIHTVELTGLAPGKNYFAVAGDSTNGYSTEFKFRTIPLNETLRFVTGGDIGTDAGVDDMMIQAALHDPHFAVLGGDLAYVDGDLSKYGYWDTLLDWWEQHMMTPSGLMIPIVLAVGNHEVAGAYQQFDDPTGRAPFFFGYFAQHGAGFNEPRRAYFQRSFGPFMSLYILDTEHVTSIDEQTAWLNQTLPNDKSYFKFATYHLPLYPSHRNFTDARNVELRGQWRAIFENNKFIACFENHEHLLKRSNRITQHVSDPEGVLYIGDGCFGRPPRSGDQAIRLDDAITYPNELTNLGLTENYLAHWESTKHFWLITVPNRYPVRSTDTVTFQAFDVDGNLLDSTQITLGGAPALPFGKIIFLILSLVFVAIFVQLLFRKIESQDS